MITIGFLKLLTAKNLYNNIETSGIKLHLAESKQVVYKEGEIVFSMEDELYWDVFWDYLDDEIGLEEMIEEMERKLRIYLGE